MQKRPKLLPLLPLSTMPTRPIPPRPYFDKLPSELRLSIVSWLPIHDLPQLCRTTTQFNQICNTSQVWQQLLKQDFNVLNVSPHLAKTTYQKYSDIIDFFGDDYPIMTDLGLELMNKFVPRIWWTHIKKIYDRDARSYGQKYPDILDWQSVKGMVTWYHQFVDKKYSDLVTEIEDYVINRFKFQIERAKLFVASSNLSQTQINELINSLIKTSQTIFLRGHMMIFEFNFDLISGLDEITFRFPHPYYIDEEFYESVGTQLLSLFENS